MPAAELEISQRGAKTRERILEAAERLFATRGYAETTLREIAAQVGIQNPSIYKHFDTKAEIYDAVLERAIGPVRDEFWSEDQDLGKVVHGLAPHPRVAQLLLRETLTGGPRVTPIVVRWLRGLVSDSQGFLDNAPWSTPWDASSVFLRVLAIYHVLYGFYASGAIYRELTGGELDSEESLAQQAEIVRTVAEALLGPEAAK